jgi:hypothetical protein
MGVVDEDSFRSGIASLRAACHRSTAGIHDPFPGTTKRRVDKVARPRPARPVACQIDRRARGRKTPPAPLRFALEGRPMTKEILGALGWSTVALLAAAALPACDDTKATCEKMCGKVKECVPAAIEDAMKSVPAGAGALGDTLKEKMKAELDKAADECKKQCGGEGGKEITDADKKKIGEVKKCMDKDCKDFMKCMETAMK